MLGWPPPEVTFEWKPRGQENEPWAFLGGGTFQTQGRAGGKALSRGDPVLQAQWVQRPEENLPRGVDERRAPPPCQGPWNFTLRGAGSREEQMGWIDPIWLLSWEQALGWGLGRVKVGRPGRPCRPTQRSGPVGWRLGSSHLEAESADQGPALRGCSCRPSSGCWSGMSMELDLEQIRNFHPGDLGEEWGRKEAGMTPECECLWEKHPLFKKKKVFHNINYIQENKAQEAANLKNSSAAASLSLQSPGLGPGVPVLFGGPPPDLSGGHGAWLPW